MENITLWECDTCSETGNEFPFKDECPCGGYRRFQVNALTFEAILGAAQHLYQLTYDVADKLGHSPETITFEDGYPSFTESVGPYCSCCPSETRERSFDSELLVKENLLKYLADQAKREEEEKDLYQKLRLKYE